MLPSRRHARRPRPPEALHCRPRLTELEGRETPAVAYALSNGSLLAIDALAPSLHVAATAVTGLGAGETLASIDVSPTNNLLYGLATTGSAVRLYTINTGTGAATPLTATAKQFDNGTSPVPITGTNYGFDIDPVTAYARVVTDTGFNFRIDSRTGLLVDGDNGSGSPAPGVNPDHPIVGGTVTAAAFTNGSPGATATTLYTLAPGTGTLFIQNTPVGGTETAGVPLTLNGSAVTFSSAAGFDLPPGVKVTASNAAATGSGYAALTIAGSTGLYKIDVGTGALTLLGNVGTGAAAVQALTIVDGNVQLFGTDAGVGGNAVNAFNADGSLRFAFQPFGAKWTGGVRVASGDVTGDGIADIVAAPGPGGGPRVVVYDGLSGQQIASFFAYGVGFTGGVYVAAADVNGDGYADIITAPGAGGGPHIEAFSGKDGTRLASFFAFDPRFAGGATVAAGDLNGDGLAEIIVGAGPGGGPRVEAFQVFAPGTGGGPAVPTFNSLYSIFAFTQTIPGGVYVSYGTAGATPLVLVGSGSGSPTAVAAFDKAGKAAGSFAPYGAGFTGGARVGFVPGAILTAPGPGGGPNAKAFDIATLAQIGSTYVFDPNFTGGVFVG